jgi:putative ABC transport system permease protein
MSLTDDLRDAAGSLGRQPRFLTIAALTLALGIGAVTAIFSVVNAVLLRPLPYPQADRLVNVWSSAPGLGYDQFPLSPDIFLFYQRHTTVFEDMALFQNARVNLTESGPPEVIDAAVATHGYFTTLGAAFSRGRPFTADEDTHDAPRVAVVSHRLWTRRYGADPGLVGLPIRIDGHPSQVVGIAPAWMDRAGSPDLWLPTRFNAAAPPTGTFGWSAIGRLKPGVGPEDAAANLTPLVRRAMDEYIQGGNYRAFLTDGGYHPRVNPMHEDVVGSVREPLWILLGTVGMVLLVACANVANLSLVRAESRQRELAVRTALGSSRGGLVRKLLAESLLLALCGTLLGVLAAWAALPMLLRLAPDTIPRLDQVGLDGTVLAFAAGIALLSALVVGLIPAIRYTRPGVMLALRHGGRSATDHPGRQRGRQALVIAQTALALILLVGSGLLARSFTRLLSAEQHFDAISVLTFRVALPQTTYPELPDVARFTGQLVDRLAEVPGVESAGATSELPVVQGTSGSAFEIDGVPLEAGRVPPMIHFSTVTPGYFTTLRIPLQRGADFDSSDLREDARTVIVNAAAAERYWPGQDPIGRRLRPAGGAPGADTPWLVVKGIVADVRDRGLREPARPILYFAMNGADGRAPRAMSYALRGPGIERHAEAVRQAVWALNPDLPVASLRTMEEVIEESVVQFTFTMVTLGIAAVVALLLGAIGLYGVLSYAVSLQTRDIGVRLALGAQPSRVMRGVLASAAVLTAIGLVIGALGAAALTRFLGTLLYETAPLDVATFAGMSALLFVTGLLAAYLPARRAASVSPVEAMRGD